MIHEFPTTPLGADAPEVQDIPGPKHVWVDGTRIVVYTGEDVPQPVEQD